MVVTFYSFKGGVGRTQLLANAAVGLANRGLDLVLMDMDFESPGLHAYFFPTEENPRGEAFRDQDLSSDPGLIDILTDYVAGHQERPDLWRLLRPLHHPSLVAGKGSIRLLPPGRLDAEYPRRIAEFSWERFYEDAHGYAYIEYLRDTLLSGDDQHRGADLILVDSRTGLTDAGNICTGQLPDILVILFALHSQGIDGARRTARSVRAYRDNYAAGRPREILLLPARVDDSGSKPDRDRMLAMVAERLAREGTLLDDIDDRIPYEPLAAYGEQIVVGEVMPTLLSKAYDRFTTKLLELTGLGHGCAHPLAPVAPRAAPVQLLGAIGRLQSSAGQIRRLWDELDALGLDDLSEHTRRIMSADRVARSALAEALRAACALDPAQAAPHAAEPPDQATDWPPVAERIGSWGKDRAEQWIESWISKARTLLLAAGGCDSTQVEERLSSLREAAYRNQLAELEARLAEAEQILQHDSLDARLKQRALKDADLREIIPDPQKRWSWIDAQFVRLQEESNPDDPEERVKDQLFNVLELLATTLAEQPSKRPDPGHWGGYDLLCALINPRDEPQVGTEERDCFERIGRRLWHNDWQGLIEAPGGSDPSWPSGLRARDQLRRLAESHQALIEPLVSQVAHALAQSRQSPRQHAHLFASRQGDPVLERAVLAAGRDSKAANRREILGGWLHVNPSEGVNPMLGAFLSALAEDGYEAEAFFGACAALAAKGHRNGDPQLLSELASRHAVLLLQKAMTQALDALLVEPDFVTILGKSRAGQALSTYLAGFGGERFGLATGAIELLRQKALHGDWRGRLPLPVVQWLETREQRRVCQPEVVAGISKLCADVEAAMEISVYRNWDSAVYFKNAFQQYWQSVYHRLRDANGPGAPTVLIPEEDADEWIERTFRDLRDEGKHVSRPDSSARDNLRKAYQEVRAALQSLSAKRPSGWSIRDVLEQQRRQREAETELRNWIGDEVSGGGTPAAQRVLDVIQDDAP
jgi:hypothetical protein